MLYLVLPLLLVVSSYSTNDGSLLNKRESSYMNKGKMQRQIILNKKRGFDDRFNMKSLFNALPSYNGATAKMTPLIIPRDEALSIPRDETLQTPRDQHPNTPVDEADDFFELSRRSPISSPKKKKVSFDHRIRQIKNSIHMSEKTKAKKTKRLLNRAVKKLERHKQIELKFKEYANSENLVIKTLFSYIDPSGTLRSQLRRLTLEEQIKFLKYFTKLNSYYNDYVTVSHKETLVPHEILQNILEIEASNEKFKFFAQNINSLIASTFS